MKAALAIFVLLLAGCGGGADLADTHDATIQPVDCGGGITCK